MYALLFPKNGASSLTPTTTDRTYAKLYKVLDTAEKSQTVELVKSSEATQYLELKASAATQKILNCLTEIEKELQQMTEDVQKGAVKIADPYLSTIKGRITVMTSCLISVCELGTSFNRFQEGGLRTAAHKFYQQVEILGESLQHRIEHSLKGIKSTIEETRKFFKNGRGNPSVAIAGVDSRLKTVCENFDTVKAWSQDQFLRGIQEAKEEFEMAVNEGAEKFKWEATRAVQRFRGFINSMREPSPPPQQQIHKIKDEVIQIQFEEPTADFDESKLDKLLNSMSNVTQEVERLKRQNQKVVPQLTTMNIEWMSSVESFWTFEILKVVISLVMYGAFALILMLVMSRRH